jgi:hypothetical protein
VFWSEKWSFLGVKTRLGVSLFGEIWCTLAIVNYSTRKWWKLTRKRVWKVCFGVKNDRFWCFWATFAESDFTFLTFPAKRDLTVVEVVCSGHVFPISVSWKMTVFAHGPEKRRFGVFSGSKHEFSWCCRCYGQIALSLNRFWRVLVGFEHLARPVSGVMMYYGLLRVVKTRVLEWKWRVFGCFWRVLGVRVSLFGEIWCTLAIVNYSNRGCWNLCVRRPLFEGPEDLCSDQGPHSWLCE